MSASPASALEIARALIRCPSVTPADAGALPYLARLLKSAGFRAELVTFSEPGMPDILNLWARYGSEAPNFVFAGHTDVAPTGTSAAGATILSRGKFSTASFMGAAPAT